MSGGQLLDGLIDTRTRQQAVNYGGRRE